MMKKRIILCLIALLFILLLSGCGQSRNNYKTRYDPETKTLTVSGKGKVSNLYGGEDIKYKYKKEKIEKIILGEGISEIQSCFNDMVGLKSIVFPNSLLSIYDSFKGKSVLQEITIPATIKRISEESFSNAPFLKSINLSGSIYLGYGAFNRLPRLESIVIPKDSVCEGVFKDCALNEVVLEKNVQLIELDGEWNFSRSTSDDFPKAYRYTPTDGEDHPWGRGGRYEAIALSEDQSWKRYRQILMKQRDNIPMEKIKTEFDSKTGTLVVSGEGDVWDIYPFDRDEIGEKDDPRVKKIILGEGITGIFNSFNHLVELEKIEFPSTLEIIDESFNEARNLQSLRVPDNVKKIVNYSFLYCYRLKDLNFDGAIHLGAPMAFSDLAVETLIIPGDSVIEGVFNGCLNLKEIVVGPRVKECLGLLLYGDPEMGADYVFNFDSGLMQQPRVYICFPRSEEGEFYMSCGEYGGYCPIFVPEGASWEEYRNQPLKKRDDFDQCYERAIDTYGRKTDEERRENQEDFHEMNRRRLEVH